MFNWFSKVFALDEITEGINKLNSRKINISTETKQERLLKASIFDKVCNLISEGAIEIEDDSAELMLLNCNGISCFLWKNDWKFEVNNVSIELDVNRLYRLLRLIEPHRLSKLNHILDELDK